MQMKDDLQYLIQSTETLLEGYTKLLDERGDSIGGKLRIKLGVAELNLYKIIELMREEQCSSIS